MLLVAYSKRANLDPAARLDVSHSGAEDQHLHEARNDEWNESELYRFYGAEKKRKPGNANGINRSTANQAGDKHRKGGLLLYFFAKGSHSSHSH